MALTELNLGGWTLAMPSFTRRSAYVCLLTQWCEIKNSAKFFFSALPGVTYNVFIETLNPTQSIKPGVTTEYYYISYCRFLVFDAGNFCDWIIVYVYMWGSAFFELWVTG